MSHRWTGFTAAMSIGMLAASAAIQAAGAAPAAEQDVLPTPLTPNAFTQAVLARSPSLAAMRETVVAAVARIRPAGALEDPMLSVSAAPRTLGSASGPGGDIEVSQALPWWGTLDARKEAARAEAEAARDDFQALRLRLAALARGAFADWVFVHRALKINAAKRRVIQELHDMAQARYAAGKAPQGDVLEADVERTLLEQEQLGWQRQMTAVQARMNALLDRAPPARLPNPAALPSPGALPAEIVFERQALQHPALKVLEAQQSAAADKTRLAEKKRFPTFQVSAGYNSMWADSAMRPMVGLSFTMPIDQGKYRAEIDAAQAEALRAGAVLEEQRTKLRADVASDYAATVEAGRSIVLSRDDWVPLAQDALKVALAEYATGKEGFPEVLEAERRELEAELGLARVQSEYFRRLAELDEASGTGAPRSDDDAPASATPQPDVFEAGGSR